VISAGVLIGTEVFGAACAAAGRLPNSWALTTTWGTTEPTSCKRFLAEAGIYVMVRFFYIAFGVEPIVKRE
jgi:hypothetical protein